MISPPKCAREGHPAPPGTTSLGTTSPGNHPPTHLDLDQSIPLRLRALRLSLGLSAALLDRRAGFSAGTTGRLERGDLRIYGAHLFRISKAIGINIGYFYNQPAAADTPDESDARALETHRLLIAYMKIQDPMLKRDIFELIETLAEQSEHPAR